MRKETFDSRVERQLSSGTFTRDIVVGLAGGLAGTIAMHVFGVGIFLVMGQPTSISFSIIGDAAASFFARLGVELAGGAPLGMVVFYLLGLALGVTFVALVSRIDALRLNSIKKGGAWVVSTSKCLACRCWRRRPSY